MIGVEGLSEELASSVASVLRGQMEREHQNAYAQQARAAHTAKRETQSVEGVGNSKRGLTPPPTTIGESDLGMDAGTTANSLKNICGTTPKAG